jgi:hypothetical protein
MFLLNENFIAILGWLDLFDGTGGFSVNAIVCLEFNEILLKSQYFNGKNVLKTSQNS